MAKIFSRWGPIIIWAGVIFTFSSISTLPKAEIIWWDFILKKSAHIIEYAIFFLLLIRALNPTSPKKLMPQSVKSKTWLIAFVVAILYALTDEYHQSFVPGRTAKLTDVGFDIIGAILSQGFIKAKLQEK